MLHLSTLWSVAIVALLIVFVFTFVQHFRHETGKGSHFVEWNGNDDIHYEQDEE